MYVHKTLMIVSFGQIKVFPMFVNNFFSPLQQTKVKKQKEFCTCYFITNIRNDTFHYFAQIYKYHLFGWKNCLYQPFQNVDRFK